jgi:ESCRT-II complex subunit VPS36
VLIKFHSDKDVFLTLVQKQLTKKSWEEAKKLVVVEPIFSTSNAGVGGLLRRQEREMSSADHITKEALMDLDSLMRSAKEVIGVVQRYATYAQERSEDNVSETSTEMHDNSELESILQDIGIISPVTKFSAGRMYHQELSRQLADMLLAGNLLKKLGSVATLTDIYCLFNRARGTELVSPDDFLKAAQFLDELKLGLKFKRFKSGVLSIQLDEMGEKSISQHFLNLCSEPEYTQTGINATIVSSKLNMSIIVAKEELIACESAGYLCRDESIQGIFYFPNLFNTVYR